MRWSRLELTNLEMDQLAKMIKPDYAIVTLVGDSHLERLGSVNKVAEEKAKIFQGSGNLSKIFFLKVVLLLPHLMKVIWKEEIT